MKFSLQTLIGFVSLTSLTHGLMMHSVANILMIGLHFENTLKAHITFGCYIALIPLGELIDFKLEGSPRSKLITSDFTTLTGVILSILAMSTDLNLFNPAPSYELFLFVFSRICCGFGFGMNARYSWEYIELLSLNQNQQRQIWLFIQAVWYLGACITYYTFANIMPPSETLQQQSEEEVDLIVKLVLIFILSIVLLFLALRIVALLLLYLEEPICYMKLENSTAFQEEFDEYYEETDIDQIELKCEQLGQLQKIENQVAYFEQTEGRIVSLCQNFQILHQLCGIPILTIYSSILLQEAFRFEDYNLFNSEQIALIRQFKVFTTLSACLAILFSVVITFNNENRKSWSCLGMLINCILCTISFGLYMYTPITDLNHKVLPLLLCATIIIYFIMAYPNMFMTMNAKMQLTSKYLLIVCCILFPTLYHYLHYQYIMGYFIVIYLTSFIYLKMQPQQSFIPKGNNYQDVSDIDNNDI